MAGRLSEEQDWVYAAEGLLADCPEVLEALDDLVAQRHQETPRPVRLAWEEPQ